VEGEKWKLAGLVSRMEPVPLEVLGRPPRMAEAQAIALIIPAYNEAAVIGACLAALPAEVYQQVIVVDNGSTDDTGALARQAGAEVLSEPRRGYGQACLSGMAALRPAIDVVVFMDADLSDDPAEVRLLLAALASGADLAIGARALRALPGALSPHQRFGNWLAARLIHWRWGVECTDLGPFRAIRRSALTQLGMRDRNYGWTVEMQARAAQLGLRMVECNVIYRPRRAGRSKVTGTVTGSILAGIKILATWARVAIGG